MCEGTVTSAEAFTDSAAAITAAMNAAEAAGKLDQQGYPTIGVYGSTPLNLRGARWVWPKKPDGRAATKAVTRTVTTNSWTEIENVLGEENSRGLFTIVQAVNDPGQCVSFGRK